MSTTEEDIELRDLVTQNLEKSGCLAKIRAELRANTFLAVEKNINEQKKLEMYNNTKIKSYLESSEGRSLFYIVQEFLKFFNLQFTMSVYETEAYLNHLNPSETREELIRKLNLNEEQSSVPLLENLLKIAQSKTTKVLDVNLNLNNNNNSLMDESSYGVDTVTENNYSQDSFNSTRQTDGPDTSEYINNENNMMLNNIEQNHTYIIRTADDVSLKSNNSTKCSDTAINSVPLNNSTHSTINSNGELANISVEMNSNTFTSRYNLKVNNLIETKVDSDNSTKSSDLDDENKNTSQNDLPSIKLNKIEI